MSAVKHSTKVTICGEDCVYTFTTADTVTTIAAGLKAAIEQVRASIRSE